MEIQKSALIAAVTLLGVLGPLTPPALSQGDASAIGDVPLATAPGRDTSADNELLLAGDLLVTTATKTPQRISDSPAAITVITAEQIRRSAAKTVPDLLRSVPGVDVMSPNASQQNVSIRGLNDQFSNTLLVMVDGRSIYQDFYGTVFWRQEPLLLSRIQRIEIVRGPGSALYGANAFGGVVNIITKTPQEMAAEGQHGDADLARGQQDSTFAEASVAGRAGGGWAYVLGGGFHGTNGFSDSHGPPDSQAEPILMADAQKMLPRGTLRVSANTADDREDVNSIFVVPQGHWHSSNITATYDGDRERDPLLVRAFANTLLLTGPLGQDLDSRTYDLEAQQRHALSATNRVVYGAEYRVTGVAAFLTNGQRITRQAWSGYIQDEWRLTSQTSLFTGARLDDNSQYGVDLSPRISLVHHLDRAQTLRLSYGQAFRAPTLLEDSFHLDTTYPIPAALLPPGSPPVGLPVGVRGNPRVRPERLGSLEVAYRRDLPGGYVGVDAFLNKIDNTIQFTPVGFAPSPPFPPGQPTLFQAANTGRGRAVGVELEAGFPIPILGGLRGQFNYAYQDVVAHGDQAASFSPHHKANMAVETADAARIPFRVDLHYVGPSVYADVYQGNTVYSLGAYLRADAKIGYRAGKTTFSLAATNLLGDGHWEFPEVSSPLSPAPQSFPQDRTTWVEVATHW